MKDNTYADCVNRNFLSDWNAVAELRKPIIAAVNGYAVGVTVKRMTFFESNHLTIPLTCENRLARLLARWWL